ncbi:MAG TPA: hypothetical protein VFL61_07150 [Gaiellaceae bacterium]|nr:hypothetical protein [Gaiellaceae bacterium]
MFGGPPGVWGSGCTAGCVERHSGRKAVEDLPDNRLLDVDELVPPGLVVELGPVRVHVARGDRMRLDPFAERLGRI